MPTRSPIPMDGRAPSLNGMVGKFPAVGFPFGCGAVDLGPGTAQFVESALDGCGGGPDCRLF